MVQRTPTSRALWSHGQEQWELTLPLNPVPASRPRVSRWGTYYPKTYARWKKLADDLLRPLPSKQSDEIMYVSVSHVVEKPKTGKLAIPNGDVDNYLKATLDAITTAQIVWHDDKQIRVVMADKRYALPGEAGHTHVRASLSWGALWLAEPINQSADIFENGERVDYTEENLDE